jgi:uncharacterized protein (UPF0333 family)
MVLVVHFIPILLTLLLVLFLVSFFHPTKKNSSTTEPFVEVDAEKKYNQNIQTLHKAYNDLSKQYDTNYQTLLNNYNDMISTMNKSVDGNDKAKSLTSQLNATTDVPL